MPNHLLYNQQLTIEVKEGNDSNLDLEGYSTRSNSAYYLAD